MSSRFQPYYVPQYLLYISFYNDEWFTSSVFSPQTSTNYPGKSLWVHNHNFIFLNENQIIISKLLVFYHLFHGNQWFQKVIEIVGISSFWILILI